MISLMRGFVKQRLNFVQITGPMSKNEIKRAHRSSTQYLQRDYKWRGGWENKMRKNG